LNKAIGKSHAYSRDCFPEKEDRDILNFGRCRRKPKKKEEAQECFIRRLLRRDKRRGEDAFLHGQGGDVIGNA